MEKDKKKNKFKIIIYVVIGLVVAIQLVPVDRENPAGDTTFDAPAPVMSIVKESCFDCHSNETVWPWYSYVAPVSWLVASDVEEGREHLNLSGWGSFSAEQKTDIAQEMVEMVEKGEMPLDIYLTIHSHAEISADELTSLKNWAAQIQENTHSGVTQEEPETENETDKTGTGETENEHEEKENETGE